MGRIGGTGNMGNGERDQALQNEYDKIELASRLKQFTGPSPPDLCICGTMTRAEHGCLCAPESELLEEIYAGAAEESRSARHPNSARFHELLREAGRMHDRKQSDYGRGDDPFANVRASEEWGISGWVGAMVRAQDKVRRLQTHSTRGSLVNESVADSLLDLAVYALIALVLYEEESAATEAA